MPTRMKLDLMCNCACSAFTLIFLQMCGWHVLYMWLIRHRWDESLIKLFNFVILSKIPYKISISLIMIDNSPIFRYLISYLVITPKNLVSEFRYIPNRSWPRFWIRPTCVVRTGVCWLTNLAWTGLSHFSNELQLLVPRYNQELYGKRAFSVAAPRLWNSIREAPTLSAFHSELKTFFRKAYPRVSA